MMKTAINMVETIARMSQCKRRKVGAVLTDEDFSILSCGFNAILHEGCCKRQSCESGSNLERCNAIHAEMVAVANWDIKGKKLFVNLFPCPICSKYLATAGLAELYYYEDYNGMEESLEILSSCGTKVFKYKKDGSFQKVNKNPDVNVEKKEEKKKYFGA